MKTLMEEYSEAIKAWSQACENVMSVVKKQDLIRQDEFQNLYDEEEKALAEMHIVMKKLKDEGMLEEFVT